MLLPRMFGYVLLFASSSAELPEQCNTEEKQKSPACQTVCSCDCDATSPQPAGCSQVCQLPNKVQSVPWCNAKTSPSLPAGVEIEADVTYMTAYGVNFSLDIYTNNNTSTNQPLALIIHGGGFVGGDKAKEAYMAAQFAARGFRAISINYPLCKDVYLDSTRELRPWDTAQPPVPGVATDCVGVASGEDNLPSEVLATLPMIANRAARMAIKYMHTGDRPTQYHIDTDRTVCHGASAGAITCYITWLFNTSLLASSQLTNAPTNDPVLDQYNINVAAARAGGFAQSDLVTQETVNAMAPGAAVWDLHGDEDTTVHINQSSALMSIAQTWSIPNKQVVIPGGGHGVVAYLGGPKDPGGVIIDGMFNFISTHLFNTGGSTTAAATSTPTDNPCADDDAAIINMALRFGVSVSGCTDPQVVEKCDFDQVVSRCCSTCAAANQAGHAAGKAYSMGNPFENESPTSTSGAKSVDGGFIRATATIAMIFLERLINTPIN